MKVRRILFNRESASVKSIRSVIARQNHRTLVMWAIECGQKFLEIFEYHIADDLRPREALAAARFWARGDIKMPAAKKAAHATHNAATQAEFNPAACAAARVMGHVVGTVHVETHAIGIVLYGLTALIYNEIQLYKGIDSCTKINVNEFDNLIEESCKWMLDRLLFWESHIDSMSGPWADFLTRDDGANKEFLLMIKENGGKWNDVE